MACNSDCEGICCILGSTPAPSVADPCVCNAGVGATFVGSTGVVYIRLTDSEPCSNADWATLGSAIADEIPCSFVANCISIDGGAACEAVQDCMAEALAPFAIYNDAGDEFLLGPINAHSDVDAAPIVGDVLCWSGSQWIACASDGVTVLDTNTVDLTLGLGNILSAQVRISADADNCLEARLDGLYVPCTGALENRSGDITFTDPVVRNGPIPPTNIQVATEVITNPSTTQSMTVHITATGSEEVDHSLNGNVNVAQRMLIDGALQSVAVGENGQIGLEYGWSGSTNTTVVIPPGGSVTLEVQNRLTLPVAGTTAGPINSRISYSWIGILTG